MCCVQSCTCGPGLPRLQSLCPATPIALEFARPLPLLAFSVLPGAGLSLSLQAQWDSGNWQKCDGMTRRKCPTLGLVIYFSGPIMGPQVELQLTMHGETEPRAGRGKAGGTSIRCVCVCVCGLRLPQDSPHHGCGHGEPSGRCEGPSSMVALTPLGAVISMSPGEPQDGLWVWCFPILSEKGRRENQQGPGLQLASALPLPVPTRECGMWSPRVAREHTRPPRV